MAVLNVVKLKDVWYKENIMAGCGGTKMKKGGMTKKYEKGGEVDKSKGVKGRTSAKAKEDQKQFQIGYARGLKDAENNFNLKGDASKDTVENKLEKGLRKVITSNKNYEGYNKGKKDMDAALKGQGAYKKGGKVKPGYHKMPDGKMMKDSDHKKKKMKSGGMVKRDGCAVRGKTKGRMV